MKREKLEKLASEKSNPCVTISMNTHRTHPDNVQDVIVLKNLLKEARERVLGEFSKHPINNLLDKIENLEKEIDVNYNLDSLHIFLSDSTKEIIKSSWPTPQNTVAIDEKFTIRPLIKLFNRAEEYMILLLSQSGARLLHANNDLISGELENNNFPFTKDGELLPNKRTTQEKLIDGKQADNLILDFLNKIDKAVVKEVYNKHGLKCVVMCTEDNYSRLMQVADKPFIYLGNVSIDYKDVPNQTIAAFAWKLVNALQHQQRADAISEMMEASGEGKVITDLQDIFRAVREGRGELLISKDDFRQAVKMTGEFSFDLVDDVTLPGVIDDITSEISWEVISKKGRTLFTEPEETNSLGDIALKVRY
jgi:Bacterial archaeo-eukaryotic release factor family 3